ncbi:dynein axonemal heavy chain 17-like isoform X2 [Narcine bancroftii]|uniref:dynein axonemal heavy chain 17-like isoform X2 n=1 Tax=Narcine bancroftii TaxID=1343680 RepID=UPI0038310530
MNEEEETVHRQEDDPRMAFLQSMCLLFFCMKEDKWEKISGSEENRQIVMDFFGTEDILILVIYINAAGQLTPNLGFPSSIKTKGIYFVKKKMLRITDDNIKEELFIGDISNSPVEQLLTVIEEVVCPLFTNTDNMSKWPQVVSEDVVKHAQQLKNDVFVVGGQLKGKALLALPKSADTLENSDEESDGSPIQVDSAVLHAIESVVIDWMHQVKDVLTKDSAQSLLDGLNPLPREEIDFWDLRLKDLKCLNEQLWMPKVRKISEVLEKSRSSYWPALKNLYDNIRAGLEEASDIVLHLIPLKFLIDDAMQTDYEEVSPYVGVIIHTVCLVWANSKYYNTPARIIVILQEIFNLFIEMTCTFLNPDELMKGLQGEIEEVLATINMAISVLRKLYETYDYNRLGMNKFFKDREPKYWEFPSHLVFGRLDKFMHRLQTLEEMFSTTAEFLKLEKSEVGGIGGNILGQMVQQIYAEFLEVIKILANSKYNPLDPQEHNFEEDCKMFQRTIEDFDRRLAMIISQGFSDCSNITSAIKLLNMFGFFIKRPLIKKEMSEKYSIMVDMANSDLDDIKLVFDAHLNESAAGDGFPSINRNMPRVAGELKWALEMNERMEETMKNFKSFDHFYRSDDEAKLVFLKYEEMKSLLQKFCEKIHNDWVKKVDKDCQFNLNQPLIFRNPTTDLISVRFSKKLVAVLREVNYMNLQGREDIPESGTDVFSMSKTLRNVVDNLNLIVGWYNKIKLTILDVEYPLIRNELADIDFKLIKAERQLYWNSQGIWEYIQEMRIILYDLDRRIQKSKYNIEMMRLMMLEWSASPLFERGGNKKDLYLDLDGRPQMLNKRYAIVGEDGEKLHALLEENRILFKAEEKSSWEKYVNYVDGMVIKGFYAVVHQSLQFLLSNMESEAHITPLFEVRLELTESDIDFRPTIGIGSEFHMLIENLMNDVYKLVGLVPRLAKHSFRKKYQIDLEEMTDLSDMREEVMSRMINIMKLAEEYKDSFDDYSYLWVDDRNEFLEEFLIYGRMLTQEEIESYGEGGVPPTPPTLQQFKDQIDSYEVLYEEVFKFDSVKLIAPWFKIDCRPFRQALLNLIKLWSLSIKQYLIDHVTNSLNTLEAFIKETNAELSKTVKEGDLKALIQVMGYLNKVKERQVTTDNMFEPLKQTIELLKTYNVEMPEEVHIQLHDLPEKWNNTKKITVICKHAVSPLQANEVNVIRRKCLRFEINQHGFRQKFKLKAPFNYDNPTPYKALDKAQKKICAMEDELQALSQSAALFEVAVPDCKQLKTCRKEVGLLKDLWDMAILVSLTIDDWKTTKWKNISVDNMDADCKKFVKDIRTMEKEIRAWNVYSGLDNLIKNTMTSLKAVSELQNPAIRDRHWQQLMQATKVKFVMSKETTLADLLSLQLHNFEDEVRNIVDKSVKESGMEKVLNQLDNIWSVMEFEHDRHSRTGIMLLKGSDELVETLEDNQVQLQSLMASKFIAYFLKQVSSWQNKLSTADSVIAIWFEVQRTWVHLESIFIGSEDIRIQLPEDSKHFEAIDVDFKEIVADAIKTPNVIEATNKPGLYSRLEEIQGRMTLCEKALAEYLETKRLAFPRFYFVASADLLDILSNGNNPVEVEIWLNRLLDRMRATLRQEIAEAVIAYEEKPREPWIFEYPAQIALTGTQIIWNGEVSNTFAKLEEGYENAMKDYMKKQISQLNVLITLLIGNLTAGDRQKIMTICTIEVHARDVINKLITTKVENIQAFAWQSQLRHCWDDEEQHCFANICDAQFRYSYEYLGNTPRLVITPLTDRCYITLTQSLHLIMGGAPAGPAGTGKTETTKDLGRALGTMVYVFNCSEQMDYKSCGNIYKGLAQSGAWGCFDEFNRISVEVLSVIAVQVKCVQDAIRDKKERFNFLGENIVLVPSVGIFITMNPGYAGRTELPENLKALFRPCAMVVPDFELICEIMLVAEGFVDARLLARKFITLYTLCKELLSKQDHYDWGLRAIKSVLVVAGSLKRGDPNRPEDQVLMRALRDFNIPKIVTDDLPVFMGLIGDLFPALDVPRKRDIEFEQIVKQSILELHLQPEDNFVLKIIQLEEILQVRHSVFIVGNAGSGKSQVMRSLKKTYLNLKRKAISVDLDPKAVTCDELFGIINPATREWKDGLFSTIMRDLANISHDGPKWIVLDGDIDPMWIESLNTVMDDNKILTLASNERIPLNPTMRLLFEISHLRTATPATVSRAGILYINPGDLGWNPVVASWIESREVQSEKANLLILFDKYFPTCLEKLRTGFKKITPLPEITMVQTVLHLMECLLTPANAPADSPKELYELYFVFACVWGFGGTMFQDQLLDYRVEFSKWWVNEFKSVKFPSQGTVFDYYIGSDTKRFISWSEKVPSFELDSDSPLQAALVHTTETIRLRYFIDLMIEIGQPVMLVGNAGTGKSVLMGEKLNSINIEEYLIQAVPFNFYTNSGMLQDVLEKQLEKKTGRNFGPPGTKKLIYFIDDMNMPEVDKYGTVASHTLIRQHLDHGHWYDKIKLTLKDIHNCQYVACMNPTAGSFTIDSRLQRHFCVFAVSFPGQDALQSIYSAILHQHLTNQNFPSSMIKFHSQLVTAALALHQKISSSFLPTAIKFHYIFNLRDLSNIFQGFLFATTECAKTNHDLVRLLLHETSRVYGDKLVDVNDMENFPRYQQRMCKTYFADMDESSLFQKPNIYCHFATGIGEPRYLPVDNWPHLNKLLVDALDNYNEINAAMNLVLFEDAMAHICRINRILEFPRGNALLVGVGGSGKQSLSRLSAYISTLNVFQISLKKGYSISDLKADLATQYINAGVKNHGTVFLMTDSQVAEEMFLVLINDLLASGEIPGLFQDDELENIIGAMKNEVKLLGLQDTKDNCWKFFIERVRRQLKVVLCFSPVGSVLRVRARKFPALVNCTSINWFHEWPEDALISVSKRFLANTEGIEVEVKNSISQFMAFVHKSVQEISAVYLATERRYNYTTPKTFLEQIKLYQNLLSSKRKDLIAKMDRLENGLAKLHSTASQVNDLKSKLAIQEVELQQKNEDADKLIKVVGQQTEIVTKNKRIADEEEKKVQIINENVREKQHACEEDLAKAEPALIAAQEALNTLNKSNLTELKSFGSPPDAVVLVTGAVMILLAPSGKVPKDRSWKAAKVMMGKVDGFLDTLINYDKERIPETSLKAFRPILENPMFDADFVGTKSIAAAGLCSWCINIVKFYEVFCEVEPKRIALAQANVDLAAAQEKLAGITRIISELDENLAKFTAEFEKATVEKLKCQEEADNTNSTISLANRLVGGLVSEKIRWGESVAHFREQEKTLCGDVLLVTAFVSYVGYFTKKYRNELLNNFWMPFLEKLEVPIPITENLDPLTLLTDHVDIAAWNNQGLPSDRTSSENATILCNTERWPLLIDAQLQGIKWIKRKFGDDLKVIRLGQRGYLDRIENAVSNGDILLLENISETVEAVLDPLLGRNTVKKGKYIYIGDKEVEYHPKFRMILHTKYFNPHFKPEMQAQCTLINFLVTRDGLEDQLLASVVAKERPDLEQLKANLTTQQNEFKIILKQLEDSLLARLSEASGNFLGDTALVENLETTKLTATEIERKVAEAKVTELKINVARENYRPAAERASLLYFIIDDLNKINPIYQFSLKAFHIVFENAIHRSVPADDVKDRVVNLTEEITYSVFIYTTRGLFEKDKLIFTAQVAFQVFLMKMEINPLHLDFLLRFPFKVGVTSPVDFLSHQGWGGILVLAEMEQFKNLDSDIEGSANRWKKIVESEAPEKEKLPQEWKNKGAMEKLCMMRCMRPDRMTYAVSGYVEEKFGAKYVEGRSMDFAKSYEESSPSTPIFFILSPGVDPLKDVEAQGKKLGFTIDNGKFHNVSLGQGQEIVAEQALDVAAVNGHWVILQNIHLVAKWLSALDKKVEQYSTGSHADYRVFMTAEPAGSPEAHNIPQGLLENSIKITNEPPTGMYANLHKALDLFNQDTLEMCSKEAEFKCILFALCYFHAVVAERRKFGAQGWNRSYPFNNGDLTISVYVLFNYLEANPKVPWDDLRYLFGEIMYGGHITDGWDRKLCCTYLEEFLRNEMLDGELLLAPGFPIPPNTDYKGYHDYVNEVLPPESPYLYGLHPNAEIGCLTVISEKMFHTVLELQPKESTSDSSTGVTREEKVKTILDEILEKLPEPFNIHEMMGKVQERSPYIVVAFQECERTNILTAELKRSLKELNLGLKGELTITADMENISNALYFDTVPESWSNLAYPSLLNLAAWFTDLLLRIRDLEAWSTDFVLPNAVWLSGLFNPQSFLTAIMQSMARKNEWPLDKMCLVVEVTKKNKEDITSAPREGAYIHGLYVEGARWDKNSGVLTDARLKELTPAMPVAFIKAIPVDRQETKNIYECPVYKTRTRGPTYVWTFNLKTKEKQAKWIFAGVAVLLQV